MPRPDDQRNDVSDEDAAHWELLYVASMFMTAHQAKPQAMEQAVDDMIAALGHQEAFKVFAEIIDWLGRKPHSPARSREAIIGMFKVIADLQVYA